MSNEPIEVRVNAAALERMHEYDKARDAELAALRAENERLREILMDVYDLWDDNAIEHSTPENYERARRVFRDVFDALPAERRTALAAKEDRRA